jgi:hypothetical protein
MDFRLKTVRNLPLQELWNERDILPVRKGRLLSARDVTDLLRVSRVRFVVADIGQRLRWVDPAECYQFWKAEVKPHLAEPGSLFQVDDFPEQYCFSASEWGIDNTLPIVVLERFH